MTRGRDVLHLAPPAGAPVTLTGPDAGAVAELLADLTAPVPLAEISRRVDGPSLRALVRAGVVAIGPMHRLGLAATPMPGRPCRHLVVGVAGSIGALDAPAWVLDLARHFARHTDVIVTSSATRFLRPAALSAFGVRTWSSMSEHTDDIRVPHIQLAARADLVVVLFATAHTIFKLAHGAANDLLSLTVSATSAPVVVMPNMNDAMWRHPPVRRNVEILRGDGVYVIEPSGGLEAADGITMATASTGGMTAAGLRKTLSWVLQRGRE